MPQPKLLAVGLTDEHVLYVLMVPGAEVGLAHLAAVEHMTFQGFDDGGGVGGAGPLHGFQDLRHGSIPEIAARSRRVVILVDHALDETLGAVRVDLRVPDQAPDAGVIGVAERAADLLACEREIPPGEPWHRSHVTSWLRSQSEPLKEE